MNDTQLQLALAKMLPEKIKIRLLDGVVTIHWIVANSISSEIKGTEWLHVCWLVEQELSRNDHDHFLRALQIVTTEEPNWFRACTSASWQQRALALCKVKGINP